MKDINLHSRISTIKTPIKEMMSYQRIAQWNIWGGFLCEKLKNKNINGKKLLQFYPKVFVITLNIIYFYWYF